MNTPVPAAGTISWKKSLWFLALAVICFNLAYTSVKFPVLDLFIFAYAWFLIQLAHQPTVRRAFYFGLGVGFACAATQAFFFWNIFHAAAIILWLVFGFWIGLFTAISCGCILRWGKTRSVWLIPFVWTGTEYFRSELYYFKFSWFNLGYVFSNCSNQLLYSVGMYGIGFIALLAVSLFSFRSYVKTNNVISIGIILFLLALAHSDLNRIVANKQIPQPIKITGIQLEFPPENVIPELLNQALRKNPDSPLFVLSEYTLDGGVTDSLKNWCREHARYLVVGGKDVVTNDVYYDTAFVVGTNGEVIFKQAKSVPIQCFKDGLAATNQAVWDSPWGKIGICICYDLSYTRVTDALVRQGAQLLIVPSMDVEEWGKHEHTLHSRVAPVRATEYGLPIFRVASSGISQAVTKEGKTVASTGIPARGEIFSAQLGLPTRGELPFDRILAPICVIVTGVIIIILLFLNWKDKQPNLKPTKP
jgi:apolipoprotein N-acyltransferase